MRNILLQMCLLRLKILETWLVSMYLLLDHFVIKIFCNQQHCKWQVKSTYTELKGSQLLTFFFLDCMTYFGDSCSLYQTSLQPNPPDKQSVCKGKVGLFRLQKLHLYVMKRLDKILWQLLQLVEKFDLEVDNQLIPIVIVVPAQTVQATLRFHSDQQSCVTEFTKQPHTVCFQTNYIEMSRIKQFLAWQFKPSKRLFYTLAHRLFVRRIGVPKV